MLFSHLHMGWEGVFRCWLKITLIQDRLGMDTGETGAPWLPLFRSFPSVRADVCIPVRTLLILSNRHRIPKPILSQSEWWVGSGGWEDQKHVRCRTASATPVRCDFPEWRSSWWCWWWWCCLLLLTSYCQHPDPGWKSVKNSRQRKQKKVANTAESKKAGKSYFH